MTYLTFLKRVLFASALALGFALAAGSGAAMAGDEEIPAITDPLINDMDVGYDDPKVYELGKQKVSDRCAFCHGGGAHGGKGPCLTCGKFKYGSTNAKIYANIAAGVQVNGRPTPMGAFGTTLSGEEIQAIVAYLRTEQRKKFGK
jgi:mono/diheme cytochrome c family protein